MDITSRLARAASERGSQVALRCGGDSLTYAELLRKSGQLARLLSERGIRTGDAYAAWGENSLALMLLYYAAARRGAVFVPINQELSAREAAYIVDHIGASVLFHDASRAALAAEAVPEDRRCAIGDLFAGIGPGTEELPPQDSSGDFLVIYTSGSTGVPKAVAFDQQRETGGNQSLIDLWGIGPSDVTLVALPLGFLYGLSTAAATAIQAHGEVAVLRRFHPSEVLEALSDGRATIYHGVPTMFSMMLDYAEQRDLSFDLSRVRLLISAGAPLGEELRQRFERRFRKRIDDYYALTEVRPILGKPWGDPVPVPRGSLGKLAPGAQARIVDGSGRPLPDGEQGELLVRGPGMLLRYHRNEALTRDALVDGWFRTGDLGRRDADGFYYLTGRIKDIIIRGGANIAPAEVEEVLSAHPAVASAAVIGVPDEKYGEVPVAYVVMRREGGASKEDIHAFAAARLAEFKRPACFVTLDALPLGPTGKVDKKALQQAWRERR